MRKLVAIIFVVSAFFLYSCKKSSNSCAAGGSVTAPAAEVTALSDSLGKYGIHDVIQHPDGFFYKIIDKGNGASIANLCTTISFKYRGRFFNGIQFDAAENAPISIYLGQLIVGFQKALPLINKGGTMDIYLPPSLGYKNNPRYGKTADGLRDSLIIPANSYLIFEGVQLTDVQ